MKKMCIYGEYEDEILSLSEDEYKKLQTCPNCNENIESNLDRFPESPNGFKFNFMVMRCLSCGIFFSLSRNYERKYLNIRKGL